MTITIRIMIVIIIRIMIINNCIAEMEVGCLE